MRSLQTKLSALLCRYLPLLIIADYLFLLCYHCNFEHRHGLMLLFGCSVLLLFCSILFCFFLKAPREFLYILLLPVFFACLMVGKKLLLGGSQIATEPASMLFNATVIAFPTAFVLENDNSHATLKRILYPITMLTALCMSLVLVGALVGQSISLFHGTFVFGVEYSASGRLIISMLGQHQYITGYLATFSLFLAVYLRRTVSGTKARVCIALSEIVFFLVAVLSGSRNVWITLFLGGLLLAIARLQKTQWTRSRVIIAVLAILIVTIPVGILVCNALYRYILHSRRDVFYALATLTSRTTIWRGWFDMVRENPSVLLFGLPAPKVMDIMNSYIELDDYIPHMHSSFVQALCFFGLPGFLYILTLLYRCTVGCVRLWFNGENGSEKPEKYLTIPILIVLVESLFEPILFTSTVCKPLNFVFFLLVGYIFRGSRAALVFVVAEKPRAKYIPQGIAAAFCLIPICLLTLSGFAPKELREEAVSNSAVSIQSPSTLVQTAPGVTEEMLTAEFWKTENGSTPIMTAEEIRLWNAANNRMIEADGFTLALSELPETLNGDIVNSLVSVVDIPANPEDYTVNGVPTTSDYWKALLANANLSGIPSDVSVRFGYSVLRSTLRQLPTRDTAAEGDNLLFDKLIRSDFLPYSPLAVVHESQDGAWYYVIMYGYAGWIEKEAVALCSTREEWLQWQECDSFLIVTGSELRLSDEPYQTAVSGTLLPMGTKLPLVTGTEIPGTVNARSGYGCYTVKVPVRGENGMLETAYCFIPVNADVHEGYLDYTGSMVVEQAFKLLGARYGWAGDFNAFDCSGYTHAIFACFGFELPRTGIAQVETEEVTRGSFSGMNEQRRLTTVDALPAGSLLYFNGHIMVYLGSVDGEPFVISSISSLCQWDANSDWVTDPLDVNTVCVTSLTQTYRQSGYSWLNALSDYVVIE